MNNCHKYYRTNGRKYREEENTEKNKLRYK